MEKLVSGALLRLNAADIIRVAGLTNASLGQEYNRTAIIEGMQRQGTRLRCTISLADERLPVSPFLSEQAEDATARTYTVEVNILSATNLVATCTCHADQVSSSGFCPHAAALLYRWLAQPGAFEVVANEGQDQVADPQRQRKAGSHASSSSGQVISPAPAPASASASKKVLSAGIASTQAVSYSDDLAGILQQLALGELRDIAREYTLAYTGVTKQQLAESIANVLRQPERVRQSAATLTKEQRRLLAALVLAGGLVNDNDLHGLFERFSLGQPAQLQRALPGLQRKALLFRTNSLRGEGYVHSNPDGSWLDIGWFVPVEVRAALHVSVPVSVVDLEQASAKYGTLHTQSSDPYRFLSDLLLVARSLIGYQLTARDRWLEEARAAPDDVKSSGDAASFAVPSSNHEDETVANPLARSEMKHSLVLTSGLPPDALIQWIAARVPRTPAYLGYIVSILALSGIIYRAEQEDGSARIDVMPDAATLLLGSAPEAVSSNLFQLWRRHSSLQELYVLMQKGIFVHLRATTLNIPVIRAGELAEENRAARQAILSLLALTPNAEWINFQGFLRFIYRLIPRFLQRQQQFYSTPHWWLEREAGHALNPKLFVDWQRAEQLYLKELLQGPLHWWGLCDCAYSEQGQLIAFRLTKWARALSGAETAVERVSDVATQEIPTTFTVRDDLTVQVPCSQQSWPLVHLCESCGDAVGVCDEQLIYRFTPRSFGMALNRGDRPASSLLAFLRYVHDRRVRDGKDDPLLQTLLEQVEQWSHNYGRVRLYTGVSLLEVADAVVLREVNTYTQLEDATVQTLQPLIKIVKKDAIPHLVDDVKRHGLTPLVHEEENHGSD